jgi:long-subunit fatty acid transport protein
MNIFGLKLLTMNKTLTVLILALLSSFGLHAQTQKGSHLLGGSFTVYHGTADTRYFDQANQSYNSNEKTNSFSIGPSYSYFVADNLGLGVNLGYSHSHGDSYSSARVVENTSHGVFGSISLLKYLLFEKKIGIRTGPFAQYNESKAESTSADLSYNNEQNAKNFTAGVKLDFVYFPITKIGLTASLGSLTYSQNRVEDMSYVNKQKGIGLSFLNSPSFSVFYAFGK